MKTKPMAHQTKALEKSFRKRFFGYFMEQGTGKTWTTLADAERMYIAGLIDSICIIAPKGVHINWVLREIPTHMEGNIIARYWTKTGGKAGRKRLEELFTLREETGGIPPLRVFAINIDAINTEDGLEFTRKFLNCTKALLVVDESSRIKNPQAKRTKRVLSLRSKSVARRILSGTPITKSPSDAFSQMEFLEEGLLGTTSYRAFVAEYTELLSNDHPQMQRMIQQNARAAFAQVPKKDELGRPIYKNLEKLAALLAPHTFRVLKEDCLDLPPKIYKTLPYELTPKQLAAYKVLEKANRIYLEGELLATVQGISAMIKLQQVISGYVMVPIPGSEPEMRYVGEENPRLDAMMDYIEDIEDSSCIIWARFRPELEQIAQALKKAGKTFVEYHGGTSEEERELAIEMFQSGEAQFFLGNAQAAGIGLTLTAAEEVIYYSCSFDLELRLQSEDRAHRIGQKKNVVYTDLCAIGTIDEIIANSLQAKKHVAAEIQGDYKSKEER